MRMQHYASIDDYIIDQPESVREKLEYMRAIIQKAAPKATEVISYGMPAFRQHGVLVYFAAFKNHIGFFPTGSGVKAFAADLKKYDTAKGTIRFPLDKAIPATLISKITKFRAKEDLENYLSKKKVAPKKKR